MNIPEWWAEVLSSPASKQGSILADAVERLTSSRGKRDADGPTLPRTRNLLRNECQAVALRDSVVYGALLEVRVSGDVASGSSAITFAPPLGGGRILPPWWEYYPPMLADLFVELTANIFCERSELFDPTRVTYLASDRFADSADYCATVEVPDPSELVAVAKFGASTLFLDIGQKTHSGWEIDGDFEFNGGPKKVELLGVIDDFLVGDRPELNPNVNVSQGLVPSARPKNPTVDWVNNEYWKSEQIRTT